jgi:hypothetical protein
VFKGLLRYRWHYINDVLKCDELYSSSDAGSQLKLFVVRTMHDFDGDKCHLLHRLSDIRRDEAI